MQEQVQGEGEGEKHKGSSRTYSSNKKNSVLDAVCVCVCVCVYFLDVEFGGIEVVLRFLCLLCGFLSLRPLFGKALFCLEA